MYCSILGYACCTAHDQDAEAFYDALLSGSPVTRYTWGIPFNEDASEQSLHLLAGKLRAAYLRLIKKLTCAVSDRLGVILASTKGCIDDFIWDNTRFETHRAQDSIDPILQRFLRDNDLSPQAAICVSNACASSLSALYLAQQWLAQHRVDHVLILACDRVGPFVERGFGNLNAVSSQAPRPFATDRRGFTLGEAAAAILVGHAEATHPFVISEIGLDAEGHAVTRPSPSGASISRAYHATLKHDSTPPDVIIAHGTATPLNDIAEDRAFFELFTDTVPITASKWLLGHTLGASGLMDVIAACEMLKRNQPFRLATTRTIDAEFRSRYLTASTPLEPVIAKGITRVLVSSLGFGGIHAVAQIRKGAFVKSQQERPSVDALPQATTPPREYIFDFAFPASSAPQWNTRVERWYQLDAYAYGLTEFYQTHASQLGAHPALIILDSPGASNETDFQFTARCSPAKFIHTLPNIRVSPLCQVMNWTGPVLCLQKGSHTEQAALEECHRLLQQKRSPIWLLSVNRLTNHGTLSSAFRVRCTVLEFRSTAQNISSSRPELDERC